MSQNLSERFGTPSPSDEKLLKSARAEQAKHPGQPLDPAHICAAGMRDSRTLEGAVVETSPTLHSLRHAHDARLELVGRLAPKHGELPPGDVESVMPATLAAFDSAKGRWGDVPLSAVMLLWGALASAETDSIVQRAFVDFEEMYPQFALAKIVAELAAWGDREAGAWRVAQSSVHAPSHISYGQNHVPHHLAKLALAANMPGKSLYLTHAAEICAALDNHLTPGKALLIGGVNTYISYTAQILAEAAALMRTEHPTGRAHTFASHGVWSLSLRAFRHRSGSQSGADRLRVELARIQGGIVVVDHAELLNPVNLSEDRDLLDCLLEVDPDDDGIMVIVVYRRQLGQSDEAVLATLDVDKELLYPCALVPYEAKHSVSSIRVHYVSDWAALGFGFFSDVLNTTEGPFTDAIALSWGMEFELERLAMPGIGIEAVEAIRTIAATPEKLRDWALTARQRVEELHTSDASNAAVNHYRPLLTAALKEVDKLPKAPKPIFEEKAQLTLIARMHVTTALLGSPWLRFTYPTELEPDDQTSRGVPNGKADQHGRIREMRPMMTHPDGRPLDGASLDQDRGGKKGRAG